MEGLGVGAVVYDRTLDRQGVVIDASPMSEPNFRLIFHWPRYLNEWIMSR